MVMKRCRSLVAGSLVCGAATLPAFAEDTDVAAMRTELAQMRAEIAQLKAETGASWMDQAREQEMRALVEEVMSDVSSRSAFQEGGLGAGHDGKKFYLEGNGFRLNVGGQMQFRWVYNTSDARTGDAEELDGFEMRRTKLSFDGYIGDPKLGYTIVLASDRDRPVSDADVYVTDAIIDYKFDNGVKVSVGRMKLPFLAEELLSSKRLLAADRGMSTEFFTAGRAEQIQVEIPIEEVAKVYLAYSDGANTDGTGATADTVDYAVTGRVQAKLAGEWDQMKDLVAVDQDFAAFVGGAVHLEETEGAGGDELVAWTVDGVIKTGNLAAMAAIMMATGDTDDRDQFGVLAQAGYNINEQWQPFIRWDHIDDDAADEIDAFTFGVNYFLKKHNAKFTADVVYVIEPEDPSAVVSLNGGEFSSGLGLSSTGLNGDDDQIAFRAQFQLLF